MDIIYNGPFTDADILRRHGEYEVLSETEFQKKDRALVYKPATITIDGKTSEIQLNHCYNPFCKWYGLPQQKYMNIKSKPSRYKLTGASVGVTILNHHI